MVVNRLQKDTAELFKSPPPDTIVDGDFTDESDMATVGFIILGPESTAYYGGGWRVTLKIPPEYPQLPPKAYFNTKIFHPNVQPNTGEVCVDTLKRDWTPKLNFSQIILTIRCLLIQPNPESSLNEEAGKLLLEDYSSFERTARIMTKVHALNRDDVIKQYGHPRGTEDDLKSSSISGSGSINCGIHVDEEEKKGLLMASVGSGSQAAGQQTESIGGILQPVERPPTATASAEDGIVKKKKKVATAKKGLKRL